MRALLLGCVLGCVLGFEALEGAVAPERTELRGERGHGAPKASEFFVRIPAQAFGAAEGDDPQYKLRRLLAASHQAAAAAASSSATGAGQVGKCEGVVSVYMNGHPFHGPSGVDWDSRGNMWVTNDISNSVLKVERQGGAVVFGTRGASKGLFKRPLGIVINTHDVVYVTNVMLNNIVRIYPNGEVEEVVTGAPISGPIGIETDSYDNIYVSNSQDNKILKIKYPSGPILLYASSKNTPQVAGPQDLGMDSRNNLFVANGLNNVLMINPQGNVKIFAAGAPLDSPRGISVDSRDNVFVTNTEGNEVFKADRTDHNVSGRLVWVPHLSVFATTPAKFKARNLWGLAVNMQDTVFVADWNNNDLLSIAPPGPPETPKVGNAKLIYKWDAASKTTVFRAQVAFEMPKSDGGCAITKCSVTSFPGGHAGYCQRSPCLVPGLEVGKTYYFYARCENAMGKSQPSSLSNTVTPTAPPTPVPTPKPHMHPPANAVAAAQQQKAAAAAAQQQKAAAAAAQQQKAAAAAAQQQKAAAAAAQQQKAAAAAATTTTTTAAGGFGGLSTNTIAIIVVVVSAPLAIIPIVQFCKNLGGGGGGGAATLPEGGEGMALQPR